MEAKGIAVWQPGIGDGARGASRPAEAGYRKRMRLRLRLRRRTRGDEQEPSQAGLVVIRRRRTTHGKVLYPL